MTTEYYTMHKAKSQLSKLVAAAAAGQEVYITRRGKVAARLVPPDSAAFLNLSKAASPRPLGCFGNGTFYMSNDFFEPLLDMEAAIYGDDGHVSS
jgi:prevent-host-death family protein